MTTFKQLLANKANASRSTGPRSASGKARSKRNAITHGLSGAAIVIGDEDPAEFEALRKGLENDFRPETIMECELVDHLAGLFWRLRRVPVLEASLLQKPTLDETLVRKSEGESREDAFKRLDFNELNVLYDLLRKMDGKQPLDLNQLDSDIQNRDDEMLIRLSRYELALRNGITKTLQMLHMVRASRLAREGERRTVEVLA